MKNRFGWLIIGFFLLLTWFYVWGLNKLPFTAYDEATYAQVIRETGASGQISTLYRLGQPWFEKPPLYFWLGLASAKIFAISEWSLRLPSVLLSLGAILICYFLVKELTGKKFLAISSALIFALIPFFYINARQLRLDGPLTAIILAVLYTVVLSWRRPQYLWLVAPLLALGFMMKSAPALLAIFFILVFSWFYRQWSWLKDKRLWLGLAPALFIIIPWHWQMHELWGSAFWQSYLGQHVWTRAVSGFGNTDYWYYLRFFGLICQPWWQAFLAAIPTVFFLRKRINSPAITNLFKASLVIFIVTLVVFSLARTHINTYLFPIYPFMAIIVALGFYYLWQFFKQDYLRITLVLVFSALALYAGLLSVGAIPAVRQTLHFWFDNNLRDMGAVIMANPAPARVYQLDGPQGDVLSYYADRRVETVDRESLPLGYPVAGPVYMILSEPSLAFFFDEQGVLKPQYADIRLVYLADNLALLYTEESLELKY